MEWAPLHRIEKIRETVYHVTVLTGYILLTQYAGETQQYVHNNSAAYS